MSTTGQSVVIQNKLALNKLALNKLAINKLAINKLAINKLAINKLAINKAAAEDLIKTADGREVLSYVVSCALPPELTLVAEFESVTYEFPGEVGLTPRWPDHPLNNEGKGWISSCLFARVNAHDIALPVSLRGPNRALSTTPEEQAGWPLEEGAFYGDFFTPGADPPNWQACRGTDQAAGETGGLVDRDCTEPDPAHPGLTQCGFTFAGECADVCDSFSEHGLYYRRCHAADDDDDDHDHGHGHHHHHHHHHYDHDDTFRQVITTYVTD